MSTVRFTTSFRNQLNKLYVVEIHDTDYSGDPVSYVAPGEGFILSYESGGEDRLTTPILSSRCTIPIYLEFNGTSIRTEWDDFVQDMMSNADETRFQVYITEDAEPFYKGLIQVEQLIIPDRLYTQITLTATDGLGLLASIPYDNSTGWDSMMQHFVNAISNLNLSMPIKTITNWSNGINTIWNYTRCQYDSFKEIKDDETLPFDCLTVITQILTRYECTLRQRGGAWWIMQPNYMAASTFEIKNYDATGAYVDTDVESSNVSTLTKLAGGSTWYREPAKTCTVQYAYQDSLGGANLFTSLLPPETTLNLGLIPSGNNEVVGFQFKFLVAHQEDLGSSILFRVKFSFIVQQGIYYLSNAGGSTTWTTSSASRVVLYSELKYKDFQTTAHIEDIAFITAATPDTADMTIWWEYIHVDPFTLLEVFPTGTTIVDNTDNYAAIVYGVGELNEGIKVCVAHSGTSSGEQIEPDVMTIGDKPYLRSVGRLQAYDSVNAEWDNTTGWISVSGETPMDIDTLLAREIISLQRKPVELKHYILRSPVDVAKKINGYIIINATYSANAAQWDVTGYKPVIDRAGVTYTDYVDVEAGTGGLPSGVNTTPETTEQYWQRTGTVLHPANDGDSIETTGRVHGNTATFGDETEGGDYIEIDSAGGITLHGDAILSKRYHHHVAITDASRAGIWVGALEALTFDPTTIQSYSFVLGLPSDYKAGSNVVMSLYWFPYASSAGAERVRWGLEYMYQAVGTTGTTATTVYSVTITPNENLVGYRQYKTPLGTITGTGFTAGGLIVCRLFRHANNAADNFSSSAGALMVEMTYSADKLGE